MPIEMTEEQMEGYRKFRGRCKEYCEKAVQEDATLTIVRGYYYCPFWGRQAHWWTVRPDGTIHDPTAAQFPSNGAGVYEIFSGVVECAECGKEMKEEEVHHGEGNYAFCSHRCHGRFVGVL